LTLPNGIVESFAYDQASELMGLNYTLGGNVLGNLTYAYDLDGRRTQVGGSFARTGIPLPVSTTAYNTANELTQWGTATLNYDANGNMLSSGSGSYAWDARNHLVSTLSSASFQYDPFGRRVSKTASGATTNYLYDGLNPVQELSGATPTANVLGGLLADEHFLRTDASGTSNFLTDALGSTLALADPTGAVQTQYTYDPFGGTTTQGAANANSYQFTGRENDGTGLYFYRARYYNPMFGRFVSQDPIGMAGGVNVYAFVGNAPTNFLDPLGLDKKDPLDPQQAADNCRKRGTIVSFNIPYLNIPVEVTGSATVGPLNVSTTRDVSAVVPLLPVPEPFNLGGSFDIAIAAPEQPAPVLSVGLGRNLAVGTFVNPNGTVRGLDLSVGPSIGSALNLSLPAGNICAMTAQGSP
jgi:RHS repeat-associated protein